MASGELIAPISTLSWTSALSPMFLALRVGRGSRNAHLRFGRRELADLGFERPEPLFQVGQRHLQLSNRDGNRLSRTHHELGIAVDGQPVLLALALDGAGEQPDRFSLPILRLP